MRITSVKPVPWLAVNLHHLFSNGAAFNTQSRRSLTSYAIRAQNGRCIACDIERDICVADVVQCKPAWSSCLYNMVLEGQLVTKESFLMNLAGWWNHAVESDWQGKRETQSLPGWAAGDVLSSMPRCLPGSLRSMKLLLDCLVEINDRAVCYQHSNGRRNHVLVLGVERFNFFTIRIVSWF